MTARHFLSLDGARTLPTDSLLLVERAVGDLVDAAAMGVVHGGAGLGKTFAVERALRDTAATRMHRQCAGCPSPAAPPCGWSRPP